MVSEFYNLGEDEIEDARRSIDCMIFLKNVFSSIEGSLEYIKSTYHKGYVPTRRDFDAEGYNGIDHSPVGILYLDALFTEECYKQIDPVTYYYDEEGALDELEEMYYNFKVKKEDRLTPEQYEDLGSYNKILALNSESIQQALKIGEKSMLEHNDFSIFRHIEYLLNLCLNFGCDCPEGYAINLNDYRVELLLSEISLYEIEIAGQNLLDLELYCRELVGRYGEWIE